MSGLTDIGQVDGRVGSAGPTRSFGRCSSRGARSDVDRCGRYYEKSQSRVRRCSVVWSGRRARRGQIELSVCDSE